MREKKKMERECEFCIDLRMYVCTDRTLSLFFAKIELVLDKWAKKCKYLIYEKSSPCSVFRL